MMKNVRTTMAALLTAALLSAPTTLWGQATQHGVRVVSKTDVTKVNTTDITTDGQLVGASDNSTVTVTAADKTAETTPKVARVTVRKVTDVAANTVAISGSNSVSYGASTTLTLTVDPAFADGAVSWRYVAQSDNSSNGKVEFSSQTAVSASNGQATVSVKGTGAGKVNVYAKVGNVESDAYTVTIDTKTVSSPTITLSSTSYTYDGAAKTPTVTVKDGSTTILASEYTVGYSNNTNAGTATVTITDKTGGNYTVSGSTTFTINRAAASLTCNTDALSFAASNKKDATVTKTGVSASGGSVSVSSSNTDYCTVSYANGTITVKRVSEAAWTATITVSVTADGNHTWADSNKKTFTVSAAECVTDLSMVDNAGNARTSMTTANCYMVHNAGRYKLPLVYGNAIKGGDDNTVAYKPGGNTTTTYCANFVNHAGNDITAPWIKDNKDASNQNISVKSAELLWQDADGLITNVGISGDYLTFELTKDADGQEGQEGNAVVAAKDADGTIVWSWHIWVTKQTFASGDLKSISTGTGSLTYSVTPVNLGWVGSNSTSTYYQWGRKDPFPGTGDVTTAAGGASASIADNIKNPATFYTCTTKEGSPWSTGYYNMWDAENTATGDVATATKKTVYDPCPPGFCVPTANLYFWMTGGTSQNYSSNKKAKWDSTNNGLLWNANSSNIFFPVSGFRNYISGGLYDGNWRGCYWSASPSSSNFGHYLDFNSSSWRWSSNYRADGFPVRAVAE